MPRKTLAQIRESSDHAGTSIASTDYGISLAFLDQPGSYTYRVIRSSKYSKSCFFAVPDNVSCFYNTKLQSSGIQAIELIFHLFNCTSEDKGNTKLSRCLHGTFHYL